MTTNVPADTFPIKKLEVRIWALFSSQLATIIFATNRATSLMGIHFSWCPPGSSRASTFYPLTLLVIIFDKTFSLFFSQAYIIKCICDALKLFLLKDARGNSPDSSVNVFTRGSFIVFLFSRRFMKWNATNIVTFLFFQCTRTDKNSS